jgi:hypothetical protein
MIIAYAFIFDKYTKNLGLGDFLAGAKIDGEGEVRSSAPF